MAGQSNYWIKGPARAGQEKLTRVGVQLCLSIREKRGKIAHQRLGIVCSAWEAWLLSI